MRITRSPRSYNSQIGVPLIVWLLNEQSQAGLFEAGISQPGEMESLRAIIQPTLGIMTNIGSAHQENFESLEEKCREKLSLFRDAQALVFNGDDALVRQRVEQMDFRGERLCWSMMDTHAPLYVSDITPLEEGTPLT